MDYCLARDRYNKPCRCVKIIVDGNQTDFCKFHQYMNEGYTTEMLENLELCKGCNKMYYFGEEPIKTCDKCVERGKKNREKKKESIIKCKKEGCSFKRSKENDYCLKHQLCLFENQVKDEGKKLCINYIRGCRAKLEPNYPFIRCEDCLQKDREIDHKKRHGVMAPKDDTHKICSICRKEHPTEHFDGVFGMTKTCRNCRNQNKTQDAKRDKDKRNELARVNDSKPERIAVKKEWKEQNYEKVAGYWMKSRQRLIEAGIEEYLQKNAQNAKKWRDNNPEKVLQNNESRNNNINYHYVTYQRTADLKNLDFELSFEDFCVLVQQKCHYCGEFSEKKTFNGIDRTDQTNGYILDNCVPSCQMCNMMKKSLHDQIFLQRIKHILTHNKMILNGKLYPNAFADTISPISYYKYISSAKNRDIDFKLSKPEFIGIIVNPCYICGKQVSDNHNNGIDRFDNNLGYIINNCRSCCGECNFMKNNFDYNEMMRKFQCIYKNHFGANSVAVGATILKNSEGLPKEFVETELTPLEKHFVEKPLENYFVETGRVCGAVSEAKGETHTTDREDDLSSKRSETTRIEEMITTPINNSPIKNRIMVISNKKNPDEIKKTSAEKKRLQRQRLKEKYGNEEYKKLHAQKIAADRKKRKERQTSEEKKE